jgi:hypothetical protein
MQISIWVLALIFCSMIFLQYVACPKLIRRLDLRRGGFDLVAVAQVLIVLYSMWVGASNDNATSQTGAGMLVASMILFSMYIFRQHENT